MSDSDLTADVVELRELVAGTAAEAARVREEVLRIATAFTSVEWMTNVLILARREGYREALAEPGAAEAAGRAQQARAGFRVIHGGKAARKRRGARSGGAR
jgi:hypothetical protein